MTATLLLRNAEILVEAEQTLSSALNAVDIEPSSIMAIRDGEMISADTILHEKDIIRLIHIISGGSMNTITGKLQV